MYMLYEHEHDIKCLPDVYQANDIKNLAAAAAAPQVFLTFENCIYSYSMQRFC